MDDCKVEQTAEENGVNEGCLAAGQMHFVHFGWVYQENKINPSSSSLFSFLFIKKNYQTKNKLKNDFFFLYLVNSFSSIKAK